MAEPIPTPEELPAHVYLIAFACDCRYMGDERAPWAEEQMARTKCPTHGKPRVALVRSRRAVPD